MNGWHQWKKGLTNHESCNNNNNSKIIAASHWKIIVKKFVFFYNNYNFKKQINIEYNIKIES